MSSQGERDPRQVYCLCGARPLVGGHDRDCPYPYYREDEEGMRRWEAARRHRQAQPRAVGRERE